MPVSPVRGDPAPWGPLYEAALEQVRFVDVLHGVARLAEGHGDGADADRAAVELINDEPEVVPVGPVESELVHTLHVERSVGCLLVDLALTHDLGVVAHPLEEPVDDAWRAATAARKLASATFRYRNIEYARVAGHDLLQVLGSVVLEPLGDAEAVEQGLGKQS